MKWKSPKLRTVRKSKSKSPKNQRTRYLELGTVGKGSEEITLYRAASRMGVSVPSCWAVDDDDALAYLSNSGYGGNTLHEITLKYNSDEVLDLTNRIDMSEFEDLASEYFPWWGKEHYMDRGYRGLYALWEDNRGFADLLMSHGYKYMVYEDDFPAHCVTWSMMRNGPDFPDNPIAEFYLQKEFDPIWKKNHPDENDEDDED